MAFSPKNPNGHTDLAQPTLYLAAKSPPSAVRVGDSVSPAKILIVDDNLIVAKSISIKLRESGYLVATAQDGAEAMSVLRRDRPDLILLDISFPPDMADALWNGFHIMEWLQHLDQAREIPVVIITGDGNIKNENQALATGAAAFFRKPIDHNDLLKVVRAILRKSVLRKAESASLIGGKK